MRKPAGSGMRLGARTASDRVELERLRREHAELWQWVRHLERLAEGGLQARGLAHDLGNTLTSLLAGSELALQHPDPAEHTRALRANLRHARDAARRLHAFVRYTMLATPGERTGTRLTAIVEEALTFLSHPVRKAQVTVERDYASEAAVAGSSVELLQVVGTALGAVLAGACPVGDVLTIRVEDREDEVLLAIERTAKGDTASCLDEWWAGGSGLERSVARRVVASLGGRLEVRHGARTARLLLPTVQ